jgi:hypothetical protein
MRNTASLQDSKVSTQAPNFNYRDDGRLLGSELKKVFEVCDRNCLVFTPANLQMGLSVGYMVLARLELPNTQSKKLLSRIQANTGPDINLDPFREHLAWNETLLAFIETQIPKAYQGPKGFAKLSEYFLGDFNMERAHRAGIEIVDSYSHYDY